jgi:hypothetical protein
LLCPHMVIGRRELFCSLIHKDTISFMRTLPGHISKEHILIPSLWGIGFQHTSEGYKHQSIAITKLNLNNKKGSVENVLLLIVLLSLQ